MSVKKEASGRRSIQVEVEVPGTDPEVWRAIASEIDRQAEGLEMIASENYTSPIVSNFGPGMDCTATITAWEAPKRFVAEGDMGPPGSPKMATEWTVEARAGGKCLVRVVHSLFASTDDWDNQLTGLEEGWPPIFRILRRYLEDFKGVPGSAMQFVSMASEPEAKTWEKLGGELGLLGLKAGQNWSTPDGFPRMTGAWLGPGMTPSNVVLRLDTPVPGTAYIGAFPCGGTMAQVYMAIYLYGDNAKAAVERDQPKWQAWFDERFPMPQMG